MIRCTVKMLHNKCYARIEPVRNSIFHHNRDSNKLCAENTYLLPYCRTYCGAAVRGGWVSGSVGGVLCTCWWVWVDYFRSLHLSPLVWQRTTINIHINKMIVYPAVKFHEKQYAGEQHANAVNWRRISTYEPGTTDSTYYL